MPNLFRHLPIRSNSIFASVEGYVYILSNKHRNVLYVGVTNSIHRRMLEHKTGLGSKFSSKYQTTDLLYCEEIEGMKAAIAREKQLKNWHREWKLNLIRESNPELIDLAIDWYTDEQLITFKEQSRDSETSSE